MLRHGFKNRFDRVLVRGLDVSGFELRGTEGIPGLTITHERKGVLPARVAVCLPRRASSRGFLFGGRRRKPIKLP
mgnify:CR=1 FL=1